MATDSIDNAAARVPGEANDASSQPDAGGPPELQNILKEISKALKTLRYGSIVLTVHEGQVVELSKTVRLRTRAVNRG